MGLEVATLAAIGLGVSTVGAVLQYNQGKKAAKAQKRARAAQMAAEELRAQRERRNAIREAQQKRAQAIAMGDAAGVSGSTGVSGAAGSVSTQGGANVGFLQGQMGASRLASSELNTAASAQSKGALFGAIGGIGQGLFDQTGGWTTLFGGNKPTGV